MVGDILQPTHLLFILVVALLVLGPKRLPEVGRTLGTGIRDFRAALNGEHSDSKDDDAGEIDTSAWTTDTDPEDKHEFAHAHAETTPDHHEFAHDATTATPVADAPTPGAQSADAPIADAHITDAHVTDAQTADAPPANAQAAEPTPQPASAP